MAERSQQIFRVWRCLTSSLSPKGLSADRVSLYAAGRVPASLPPSSGVASLRIRRSISPLAAPAVTKCNGGQQTVEEESRHVGEGEKK